MPQLDSIDSSAFWGIAGIVVGIVVATFFFIIGKKKTLLQYYKTTTPLITEKMPGILKGRMTIDGQPINSLFSTTISFVNSGNQRIQSSEFSVQEPLRIILKGQLYGYNASLGNQKLRPRAKLINGKVLYISFENLKPRQFFKVTILHDNTLDISGELTTGTMRKYHRGMFFYIFAIVESAIGGLVAGAILAGGIFTTIGYFKIPLVVIIFLVSMFMPIYILRKEEKYL